MNVSASARLQCCVSVDVVSENFLLRCGRKWSSTHSLTMMFAFALSLTLWLHTPHTMYAYPRCITHLWLHSSLCSPSHSLTTLLAIAHTMIMLALALSLTHSTYDCTHYRLCLPSHSHTLLVITFTIILVSTIKNEKRGDRERVLLWGNIPICFLFVIQ